MTHQHPVQAGPLSAVFGEGDLRHIRIGSAEVIERIYFAVRDCNWGTVPGRIENAEIRSSADGFSISFDCIHQDGEVDFIWHGAIRGESKGYLSFHVRGQARSPFRSNRVSICVHHPLRECAGHPCRIEKTNGGVEDSRFPDLISPHQPFLGIRAMNYEFAPGWQARIAFHGPEFETEDQRNWSDNNFKTYSPPLRLPFPVEVKAGESFEQRIELSVTGDFSRIPSAGSRESSIRQLDGAAIPLPRLGLSLPPGQVQLPDEVAVRLERLRLSHLRADFISEAAATGACAIASRLKVPLEAAVTLPGPVSGLRRFQPQVCRWLVQAPDGPVTAEASFRAAREELGADAVVAAGSSRYFAELNRDRMPGLHPDAACYPVHPQVHATDNESVMANVRTQRDVVRTARSFLGQTPLLVSPVMLGPRSLPDPRQSSPFCAAWTVGSLKYLAEAGVAAITYFETHGPHGVQDEREAYPVFRVFELLGEFAGVQVIPTLTDGDSQVETLLLAAGDRRRLLIANLTSSEVSVVVNPCGGRTVELLPYALEFIDWSQ